MELSGVSRVKLFNTDVGSFSTEGELLGEQSELLGERGELLGDCGELRNALGEKGVAFDESVDAVGDDVLLGEKIDESFDDRETKLFAD